MYVLLSLAGDMGFLLWEDKENRKGAVKPRPLCTPLGLFLRVPGCGDVWPCWLVFVFFGVGCVTLCRCEVECFDCSKCVFIDFCLYSSVLNMGRCADCCSVAATRLSTCGARLRGYTKFCLPRFGSVLNCQYRSIQVQVSIFQLSTIAALYKKRPRGVQRGAALCPFAVFSHFNVIYPLRASTVYVPYSRSSTIYAAYTAGSPQSILCNNISYRNIQSSV